MRTPKSNFDIDRYRQLLSRADDDVSRRALIDLLIEENACERLAADDAHRRATRQSEAIRRLIHQPNR
jgi:hypothetical protein